ncbi:MAG: chemotaxis protein CheX [Verrucomicrobiota bacterium]|nr:chemotaxis protein CheX [Verrucomicrobiota bacterium]
MPPPIPKDRLNQLLEESLFKVLNTMARAKCELQSIEAYRGKPAQSPEIKGTSDSDAGLFAASVGFAGELNGVCYLFMSVEFAYYISNKIIDTPIDKLTVEAVIDVCGELANMFAGAFKNALADMGLPSTLTIPTVIQGKRMPISTAGTSLQSRYLFEVDGHPVYADLLLAEN